MLRTKEFWTEFGDKLYSCQVVKHEQEEFVRKNGNILRSVQEQLPEIPSRVLQASKIVKKKCDSQSHNHKIKICPTHSWDFWDIDIINGKYFESLL